MNLVESTSLTKHYGSTRAIDSLSLTLDVGEPIALIGPNGAGKTTFLSLLCGYILPTGGTVKVLGHRPGSSALHGKLAALPQDAQLDPRFSVERQLRFFARLQGISGKQATSEVSRVLEQVQLSDSGRKKPSELSHGMRKRISIAQMLMGNPAVALMDEPTAGLDPPNVRIIRDLITANASDTTFIISSHNLDELEKVCSSVVYLTDGKLRDYMPIDQSDTDDGYMTIRLVGVDGDQFMQAIHTIAGTLSIKRRQQSDYVIGYDADSNPDFDLHLLKLLSENNWKYKHLINGRTLEDKLF